MQLDRPRNRQFREAGARCFYIKHCICFLCLQSGAYDYVAAQAMVKKARENQKEGSSDRLGVAPERQRTPVANYRRTVFGGFPLNVLMSWLLPWLETTVREEVNRVLSLHYDPSARPIGNLELRFVGEVSHRLYHGNPIKTDSGAPLQVVLVDHVTGETVINGPLSPIKVEIVVLSSEFVSDDEREDWTWKEFDQSIMRARDGKGPLLTGERNVILTGGAGIFGGVMFTDNSCWTRSKTFRLGARVVQRATEPRIKEAVSNPFSVKEHRGEKFEKRYPPSPFDDVWRLEKIGKDGPLHKRLCFQGIATVGDFLRQYEVDPSALRTILGPGTCLRTWNAIVAHTSTCAVEDGQFFICFLAEEDIILKFNSVYRVVAAAFGDLDYTAPESLTPHQKAIVERLKKDALVKRNEWQPEHAAASHSPNLLQNDPSNCFPVAHQASYQQQPSQSPEIMQPFLEDPGYNTWEDKLQVLIAAWAEGQPPGVMNSNRSSLTSLDTLGSSLTLPSADQQLPPPPHPWGSDHAPF